jgi:hypothetical protein
MKLRTMSQERARPLEEGAERPMLDSMLDFFRATVVGKASGLSDAQASAEAISTTSLTIAGIVKHLAATEKFWFSIDFAGLDVQWPWTDDNPHGAFAITTDETIGSLVALYEDECERSRHAVVNIDLDEQAHGKNMTFSLRFAYLHMIEETARHCGHLDLLREAIDGTVGQ